MSFPKLEQLTRTFNELGDTPTTVSKENLAMLEEFLLFVYFGNDHKYTAFNTFLAIIDGDFRHFHYSDVNILYETPIEKWIL